MSRSFDPAAGLRRKLATVVVASASLVALAASGAAAPGGQSNAHAEAVALEEIAAEYGPARAVVARGSSTRGAWSDVEPGNTTGLVISEDNRAEPVHSILVRGDFVVHSPMLSDGSVETTTYSSGRVVFSDSGDPLLIQFWPTPRDNAQPFGPHFEER